MILLYLLLFIGSQPAQCNKKSQFDMGCECSRRRRDKISEIDCEESAKIESPQVQCLVILQKKNHRNSDLMTPYI